MSESIPEPPPLIRLPLRVSPDRRRILDADGNAVLLQGDAAWSLIANTTLDEARFYIEDRRRKGFNTLIVSLIEYCFARTRRGTWPATSRSRLPATSARRTRRTWPTPSGCSTSPRRTGCSSSSLQPTWAIPISHLPGFEWAPRGGTRRCSPMARRVAGPGASTWAGASAASRTSSGASAATGIRATRRLAWTSSRGASAPPASTTCSPPTSCRSTRRLDVFPEHDWLDLNPTYTYEVVHRKP